MKIKFIDEQIPLSYSTPRLAQDLELTKEYNGRVYTLVGKSEKTYKLGRRIWLGIRALAKMVFSLGLNDKIRQDWRSFWNGRTPVAIYSSSPLFAYKLRADLGDSEFQFKLGTFYHQDEEFQDYQKALEYYQLAANQGHSLALCGLGSMYREGCGVAKNEHKAFEYFQAAANKGNANALMILGEMYFKGCGVEKDDRKMFECYQIAANNGHVNGIYGIGLLYEKGCGVERNLAEALKHYRLAADRGDERARLKLQELGCVE